MRFMSIAKPLTFVLFADSSSPFDRRIAFGSARETPFWPAGRSTTGFRRLGQRADVRQKRRNYAVDPYWCQAAGVVATLQG
jgi:hypothetical protein